LYLDLPLTINEAVLGATVKIPTLESSVELKIPSGTSSGQKMRLKGKGVTKLDSKEAGDLYVVTKIEVPKTIDARSKELLEEFETLNEMNLRKEFF
ncbi:MAG: J domain-containing protein, partial [Deltaproteobacteria bacterium]|nr:J domain-containing protein [Deltaproteobacteria bacterium]